MRNLNKVYCAAIGALLATGSGLASAQECERLFSASHAAEDYFGYSMTNDDRFVIVGAPYEDDEVLGTDSGAVYVYRIEQGGLTLSQRIQPPEVSRNDWFGTAFAVEGDILVIGASGDDDNYSHSGSVFVYRLVGGQWIFERKILAPGGSSGDKFGAAVDLLGGLLVVGAPGNDSVASLSGAAYMFDVGSGEFLRKLVSQDASIYDAFGSVVDLYEDKVFVGVAGWDSIEGGQSAGAVYVFRSQTGEQLGRIESPGSRFGVGEAFGVSIAIEDGLMLVGAPEYTSFEDGLSGLGAVYAYRISGDSITPDGQVLPEDGRRDDHFGASIKMHGGRALIGASQHRSAGSEIGKAYLLNLETRSFMGTLNPRNARPNSQMGWQVVLADDFALLGSPHFIPIPEPHEASLIDTGAMALFDPSLIGCQANLDGDCVMDEQDANTFLDAYTHHESIADFNSDGRYDFFDVSAYLRSYMAGCR